MCNTVEYRESCGTARVWKQNIKKFWTIPQENVKRKESSCDNKKENTNAFAPKNFRRSCTPCLIYVQFFQGKSIFRATFCDVVRRIQKISRIKLTIIWILSQIQMIWILSNSAKWNRSKRANGPWVDIEVAEIYGFSWSTTTFSWSRKLLGLNWMPILNCLKSGKRKGGTMRAIRKLVIGNFRDYTEHRS